MSTKNLLVELFVEELPPKALRKLGEAFSSVLFETLKSQGLTADDSKVTAYASPRRLAAHITQVPAQAADKALSQKLMPVTVGFDAAGNATPALLKRLAALGTDESALPKLKRENDGKAESLFLDIVQTGAQLSEGLQKALDETLAKLPIPKVMTYQLADGWSNVNFVRPAHGLVALHGSDVVAINILGLQAGNTTHGHRFEAKVETITLKDADSYSEQLKTEGAVIASFDERRDEIVRQLNAAAAKENLKPIDDEALLDEVTALVERPNVLLGQFEAVYLEVPQECLILTMKANQKYFPLLDTNNKLTNKFLIVSNISPADPSAVIGGNERVVRPRLADAKFFFDQDRKKTLESRVAGLDKVVYHNKLGTQGERTERVRTIAKAIGQKLGGDLLAGKADKAAQLAKVDLLTDMVGEFPELQGIMGRYYAQYENISDDIAYAIEDHYKPRFSGDELPRNEVGICVALADKLETLIGMFGIGNTPTGDKDPFALRRHALGVIRILVEKNLPLDIISLIVEAVVIAELPSPSELGVFIYDRLAISFREKGYTAQEVDAVLTLKPPYLGDIPKRLDAVRAFAELPEASSLASANKRVSNILKKAEILIEVNISNSLLKEAAEIRLNQALVSVKLKADAAFEEGDYAASLQSLATLKDPVDSFFDDVMVNSDDPAIKANRLALLKQLHEAMNRVADLSKLAS
ncbi:glycine--tRNA ligase subunit beta [Methyloradius palustris]|uniref:Glycine--tRNA ligase beta subunit n=1 Tax=Methyloradius palustris TaxID=2778876 RepID=A0A8D5GD51_9PROT|nr:glycine--tRNA ligase subunit beta [Methyloradius palustris]BCM24414.1 glycine--tRNA ligase beta subunit [Methyloradius palustris]